MPSKTLLKPLMLLGAAGVLAMSASGAAATTGNSGLYLGGGMGEWHGDRAFDDTADHWKLVGGYSVGWLPFLDLAAELAYVRGSALSGEVNGQPATLKVESVEAAGLVGWSLGPLGLYAKVGMADWNAQQRGPGVDDDDSGTDPVYGLGVRLRLLDMTGRLEVERLDARRIGNHDRVSLGLVYTF
ncbi:porin family protein [Halomonas campisalis]|uniref:Porin family protein n=1 Tax=Billgrantia campisalis TaxID=74661 RepID=A0ABS9PAR7_9GAMM|nr:porin family protein [Halomonas campisalis]MCG6658848.1 porin family protein [Halomonas campisalis]MDR5864503.1 porin family protein [Halomonas campisalis]